MCYEQRRRQRVSLNDLMRKKRGRSWGKKRSYGQKDEKKRKTKGRKREKGESRER